MRLPSEFFLIIDEANYIEEQHNHCWYLVSWKLTIAMLVVAKVARSLSLALATGFKLTLGELGICTITVH